MSLKEKKVVRENRTSELKFVTNIMVGILTDLHYTFPTISRKNWNRDLKHISHLNETRGLGFYTRDLPLLDDIILDVLAGRQASFSGPFGSGHSPKLFRGLWRLVIDEYGNILDSADPTAIFYLRQLALFAKKANITLKSDALSERKIHAYRSIEESLHTPSERWFMDDFYGTSTYVPSWALRLGNRDIDFFWSTSADCRERASRFEHLLRTVQRVGDYYSKHLDEVDEWLSSCSLTRKNGHLRIKRTTPFKHGPGATASTSRFVDKYTIKGINPPLKNYYLRQSGNCENFATALIEYCSPNITNERSKIVLVPKDSRGPRVIAAEPIMNQLMQQGGYSFLKEKVIPNTPASKSIDFTNQGLSREAAKAGSVDGEIATIDLSDASDRLSLHFIERLFSESQAFLAYIHACRTQNAQYNGENFDNLKKFASQGNALTFPLQTLVYYIIAVSVRIFRNDENYRQTLKQKDIRFISERRFEWMLSGASEYVRVFGDDMIVPSQDGEDVVSLLEHFQLVVNKKKSFFTGNFRESCGGDYYKGYDVTPIKLRVVSYAKPEGQQMLLDVSNEAFQKGLWHTARYLLHHFNYRIDGSIPVPIIAVTDSGLGLKCYSGRYHRHLKSRWNNEYQTIQRKTWMSSAKSWRCKRSSTSRLIMANMVDSSQPGWDPDYVQRSLSSMRMGWC